MIDDQLLEYAELLKLLYGDGVYLQRHLAKSLSEDELSYVLDIVHRRPGATLRTKSSRSLEGDSYRRAKARLAEKLDSVVVAYKPSQTLPKRIEITRDVLSQVTAASIAMRAELPGLSKHKLHLAVRQSTLPDLLEMKLFALRKLYVLSWRESNGQDFHRYYSAIEHYKSLYDTIINISLLHGQLVLANGRKIGRQAELQKVAVTCGRLLKQFNVSTADPLIIIAACPLATALAQVQNNPKFASVWLRAYKKACEHLELWDNSHRTEWLLQQLAISEYFEKRSGVEYYTKQLILLAKAGTSNWFMLSEHLCTRALKSGNYTLGAEVAYAAISHEAFRRQRVDIQRSLLQQSGYAAVFASDELLFKTYRRRRRMRRVSTMHSRIVDYLYAIEQAEYLVAFSDAEKLLFILRQPESVNRDTKNIRKMISKSVLQLKKVELILDSRKQRKQLKLLSQQLRTDLGPIVATML
jgi:hypothetical protein